MATSNGTPDWHALPVSAVIARLDTHANGLSSDDARNRLARSGPNAMPVAPPASRWQVLVAQLRSVIVLLLIVAAVAASVAGEVADTIAIAAVLVLNVALGYAVEIRAHRAVEALATLEARTATVRRDGLPVNVDARDVVPGDILLLEAGQAVAADARIFHASELRVVEAALTGESVPVSKHGDPLDASTPLPERRNMVYAGTTAAAGIAQAVVVATGAHTELGNIGRLVSETKPGPTPLEQRLDALGRQLVWIAVAVGGVTGLVAWLQHAPVALVVQTAIALAVAAVPEGLPAVSTITLALSVRRMARRRALVRRLPSVETLGVVTVICSDKTGTLTTGAMTVTEIHTATRAYSVSGDGYAPHGQFFANESAIDPLSDHDLTQALRIGATANRADCLLSGGRWIARGDPTEAALVVAGRKAGIDRLDVLERLPEVAEVPFSSERRLMATFHQAASATVAFVKGSPLKVLDLCDSVLVDGTIRPLNDVVRSRIEEGNREMSSRGLRVLALASGEVDHRDEDALAHLTFAGLAGMQDPAAPGVPEAIQRFTEAGVRTLMVTGDQTGTALAVARELGLASADASVLDGRDIDALSDDGLTDRLRSVRIFSRVSPEAKLRIVTALQRDGEVVAMLGDGVNDAAALRRADVGVTMGGRGTDVARESAAVVLEDDHFATIGVAIEEGRIVFDNIRKFVFYLFSCNLAEVIVLLGAGVAGLPLPLQPIQVLWLNLVTDTAPALALAVEPGTGDVMHRPPRAPHTGILSSAFMGTIAVYAMLIALAVFLVMTWNILTDVPAARAVTMNFMVLAFAQLLHLGNARDERPVLHPRRAFANLTAVSAVLVSIVAQVLTVWVTPLRTLLRLDALTTSDWMIVVVASALPAVAGQTLKLVRSSA